MENLRNFLLQLEVLDTIIGILGVGIILLAALFMQFFYGEAPCTLCLLQRVGLLNLGIALLLNMKYGNRVSHWALAILSAVAGMAVSIRQILLHVNDPVGFGSAVFGFHMYTWCFFAFAFAIVGCTVMLIIYPETDPQL